MSGGGFCVKPSKAPCLEDCYRAEGDLRPNILFIMMDHVTFRHYRMTRGARPVLTAYERLAARGMEFTNCHSVHPLCLPARASILTGMYANRHGKLDNGGFPDAGYPLYTDFLKRRGYRVGYFGKNHSGYEDLEERGIEGYYPAGYGNPYRTQAYREYLDRNGYGHPIYHQEWGMLTDGMVYPAGPYDLTESDNFNTYSAGWLGGEGKLHESDFLTSLAYDWIAQPGGAPFAARVDFWGPHHAYQVPEAFSDLIDAEAILEYPSFREGTEHKPDFVRGFAERIRAHSGAKDWADWRPILKRAYEQYSYIDHAIGEFLSRLEEEGYLKNTVVIVTADHGDALASHGGLVDKAGDLMEEVMQIPMVIAWPGVTDGKKCPEHVCNMDLAATILEIAGVSPPEYMDARSMVPFLKGEKGVPREDFMAEHYGHFGIRAAQRALYWDRYKYINSEGHEELYDLKEDPFERRNLAGDDAQVTGEMRRRLRDSMERYGDDAQETLGIRRSIGNGRTLTLDR